MKLVIEDEAGTRSVVPFVDDGIVIGRGSEGVTFRLADRNVSRRHARFLRQSGAVFVEDLGSLNGTRVNGERITGKRRLRDGDLVQIGDYDLAVLAEAQATVPGAPPPLPRAGADAITQRYLIDTAPDDGSPTLPAPPAAAIATNGRGLRLALVLVGLALAIGLLALVVRP
jgi:pSer/pThr/pTyr-binding forkhead associated (FHA) protein